MNQIYLPKNARLLGMLPGQYVVINILTSPTQEAKTAKFAPYFYGLNKAEPIKLEIVEKIFSISSKFTEKENNIIVTGSFLDSGFNFNDMDLIILGDNINTNTKAIEQEIIAKIGIRPHILALTREEFIRGLVSDPLYQTMISRCISKNRLIFRFKPTIKAKLLDLHLLKSKALIDNFDILNGREKYYLVFNLVSILLFIQQRKITKELVEKAIKQEFGIKNLEEIKENLVGREFLKKYRKIYEKTFDLIIKEI